jgi:hypothetical protein
MEDRDEPIARPRTILYVALAAFVLAWILGPSDLRSLVPIWLVFLVALGLEIAFFASAFRAPPARQPDRGPQPADRRRYGYPPEPEVARPDEETEDDAFELETAPALGRARRLLVGVGVIGALAVVVWVVESRTGWDGLDGSTRAEAEARYSTEASLIAEKRVTIRCDESGDYVGVVQHADGVAAVGGDLAYLTPRICHDLYLLAYEDDVRSSRTARALAVLAHEAWHLRGERDEGVTECYALQSGVALGMRLGLSEDRARSLMRLALDENALRTGASFEYRVPPECRDGGRLDLDPDGSRFP